MTNNLTDTTFEIFTSKLESQLTALEKNTNVYLVISMFFYCYIPTY